MTTAKLLTERPLVEINEETGLRTLKRELAVDLGVELIELHEWGQPGVLYSPDRTTILVVEPGLVYDGASIPALVQPIFGEKERFEAASVFHDDLYHRQAPRSSADHVFWIVARSGSKFVTPARGWFGWAGLRVGGGYAYWKDGREARA